MDFRSTGNVWTGRTGRRFSRHQPAPDKLLFVVCSPVGCAGLTILGTICSPSGLIVTSHPCGISSDQPAVRRNQMTSIFEMSSFLSCRDEGKWISGSKVSVIILAAMGNRTNKHHVTTMVQGSNFAVVFQMCVSFKYEHTRSILFANSWSDLAETTWWRVVEIYCILS